MDLRTGWPGLSDAPWSWPFGPDAHPTVPAPGGSPAPVSTGVGTGTPPLMQLVPQFDPVRIAQNSQLLARGWNSLVYHGILKLVAGEPTDRQIVIDPVASPLFPGGGLTVRANTPGTYGTYS